MPKEPVTLALRPVSPLEIFAVHEHPYSKRHYHCGIELREYEYELLNKYAALHGLTMSEVMNDLIREHLSAFGESILASKQTDLE